MRDLSLRIRPHLPAAGLFALLAVAMTWPLALHMTTAYPSFELWFGGDPNMYVWLIDWTAKTLTGALPAPAGHMLFHPTGIAPFGGYDGPLMFAFAIPLRLLFGNPILAYNLFILAALWSGAMAAYALAYRETERRWLAMIAGLAYGFSLYAMVRAGQHPNLLMIGVLPLLAIAVLRFTERPNARRGMTLGMAVLLTALSSWYYLIGAGVFLLIVFSLRRRDILRNWRATFAVTGLIAAAAILPALPMLMSGSGGGVPADADFVAALGMQPLNLVLPHPATNVFGSLASGTYDRFPRIMETNPNLLESTSYLGLLLLFAVLTLAVPAIRARATNVRLWTWTLGAFSVLALGTELRIGGLALPMPFALLREVFPFSLVRAPNRLFVFILLAATMLALPAIAHIAERARTPLRRSAFIVGVIAFLLIERIMLPFPMFTPQPSEFHRALGASPPRKAIADVPIAYPGISLYNALQITHGRPIVVGEYFYPAYTDDTFAFISSVPLLAAMVCDDSPPAPPTDEDRALSYARLADAEVDRVIVHNLILRNVPLCSGTADYARAFFDGIEPAFTDGAITVYAVPPKDGDNAGADGVK